MCCLLVGGYSEPVILAKAGVVRHVGVGFLLFLVARTTHARFLEPVKLVLKIERFHNDERLVARGL